MNYKLRVFLILALCVVAGGVGTFFYARKVFYSYASSRPYLEEVARKSAGKLPYMVDMGTECYAIDAEDKSLVYSYRLVHIDSGKVDRGQLGEGLRLGLKEKVCRSKAIRLMFLDRGLSLKFRYGDRNKAALAEVSLDRSSCAP